jgi:hypothetical protein
MSIPLPAGVQDFPEDDVYRGVSSAQDRALLNIHKDGWSLQQLFSIPNAVLPLPEPKFPPGRKYLFSDNVAVVVDQNSGRIVASLPARAALRTLDDLTPEVLEESEWATEYWERTADTAIDTQQRHHKQTFHHRDGSRWTVRRTATGGADIIKDGALVTTVADIDEAESLEEDPNMELAIIELTAYVIEHP